MKKILTIVLLSAPSILWAQGVGIGIKGGVNVASVRSDGNTGDSRTSFHFGGYVNINFSEKLGITPELLWSRYDSDLDGSEFVCDYISIPIMLRFKVIPLMSLQVGPQYNFLSKAKLDGTDYKDHLKDSDVAAALGVAFHVPLGFNGGVRYVVGLTDLSEDSDTEIKNNTLQVYIGWTIFGAK